jgi:S-adenosyl-L-methionine hydrolase (adenosine-forming)
VFITLMTDFGMQDGYNGVMLGVIYRIAPDVKIIDITHAVPAQNVLEGALVWERSVAFFPSGTVHVGVVDPGVGTRRRPIAARLGEYFYVCPDNGLLTPLLEQAEETGGPVEIVHLDQPRFWLSQVSNVFHGRDIFSPVAAHLANGVPLADLGTPIHDPVRLRIPRPQQIANGWRGEVVTIDHFGNLGTNLPGEAIQALREPLIRVAGREIRGLSRTFGDRPPGQLVALVDSDGKLAVSIVNGSAEHELGAWIGDSIEVVAGV